VILTAIAGLQKMLRLVVWRMLLPDLPVGCEWHGERFASFIVISTAVREREAVGRMVVKL
jgi:hypothetical protein